MVVDAEIHSIFNSIQNSIKTATVIAIPFLCSLWNYRSEILPTYEMPSFVKGTNSRL